nr:unnamed protein product [Digitaria exilis]
MDDPGPSSAAPEPPPPAPPEEGDGWVLLPPSEVEGVEDPKVIHWEDLQQELARLWSLSAALQAARDRKAHLDARLESALEARRAFLQQDNELAEMRQGLQDHTDHLGDLKLRTKKSSEDVEGQRAQLCISIRTLSLASKNLDAARRNLEAVSLIASYLNVPLRYPLRFGGSQSYVLDPAPAVEPPSITSVDIEQLLNYIGAESLGPRHGLANLKQLTTIIQSQQYIPS